MNDLTNVIEWSQWVGEEKPLFEVLTILNNRYREVVAERDKAREQTKLMVKHEKTRIESGSTVGSCDCDVKTNEVKYHAKVCKYRLISERDEARELARELRDALEAVMPYILGDKVVPWQNAVSVTTKAEEVLPKE